MSWSPVLQGASAERAYGIVQSLAAQLDGADFGPDSAGVASGSAGLALFLGYVARERADAALLERARAAFAQALEPVEGRPHPAQDPSLLSGLPGLGWLLQHLPELVEGDAGQWLERIDGLVLAALEDEAWAGPFYHAEGLIGLGTYLLERPRGPLAERGIASVVEQLRRRAVREDGGVAWLRPAATFPAANRPASDVYDLGIPRGVGGAIAFLAAATQYPSARETAQPLLRDALQWLLRQRCMADPLGRFGAFVSPGAAPPPRTRLGWCYGDLGLSLVLLSTAQTLADSELAELATELATLTTRRDLDDPTTEIADAGFCHGTAGAGHLYARLFDATDDSCFLAAARRWFELALAMYREHESLGGFRAVYSSADDPTFLPRQMPGLLLGSAGIGLALLSACRPVRPDWDRFFLIRLHARARRGAEQDLE